MKKLKVLFLAVLVAGFAFGQTAVKTYTADYTAQVGDDGAAIIMVSASATTVTLPAVSVGYSITIHKRGAGTINVYIDSGVVKVQNKTAGAINVKVGFVGFN